MPPRTIPWLTAPSKPPASSSSPAPKRQKRTKTPPPAPANDDDLVDADLNPLNTPPPQNNPKPSRSPSSSPPPTPPSVAYMQPGYAADDAWMMVEDEFAATAALYTQAVHRAAYAEQKRRAEARGAKVLSGVGRATDGVTARDGMAVEREGREKRLREVFGEEDGEDEVADPVLGALMNDSGRMGRVLEGLGRVKSGTRAAKGFLRSPEKIRRTTGRIVDGEEYVEGNGLSEAESDDLDGPAPKSRKRSGSGAARADNSKGDTRRSTSFMDKLSAVSKDQPGEKSRATSDKLSTASTRHHEHRKRSSTASHTRKSTSETPFSTSTDDFEPFQPSVKDETPSYLTKRKQRREEEDKKRKAKDKTTVEVPTFLF